jgi:polar amino acid transport system substrate-binding protein
MRARVLLPALWVGLVAGACVLGACSDGGSRSGDTLARIRKAGVARVGFANEAPFAYVDTDTGRLTGEAPEIARVVLKRLGVSRIEGILTEFGSLIPGLKAGRFDLIAAGMYVTPKRCRQVDFSEPTYSIGDTFLVRTANPRALHGYDDVKRQPDVRLGVVAGAVERGYALRAGVPEGRLVIFPDGPSGVAGLQADRIDALAVTALTGRDLAGKARSDGIALATPFHDPVFDGRPARGYGAFAFRPSDVALREGFDGVLRSFIGSPAHFALVHPFGFTKADLPGDVTTEGLCARHAAARP